MVITLDRNGIRFKFLGVLFGALLAGTILISTAVALIEQRLLQHALTSKGLCIITNIAKRNEDALIIKGSERLDTVLNELVVDEEIVYTVIEDAKGKILTTQFESINYKWPGLGTALSGISKDRELPALIAAIKRKVDIKEISVPIKVGSDIFGKVVMGMSQNLIRAQIVHTVLFVVALNFAVAAVLGSVFFLCSEKLLLKPIGELVQAVTRIAKGDLSTRVEAKASGEIKVLLESFNRMAEDLDRTTISKDYMNDIFKSMTEGIMVLTPDHVIKDVNDAALRLLGYDRETLIDRHAEMIFDREPSPTLLVPTETGCGEGAETWLRKKDGARVPVYFAVSPMCDRGESRGLVCVMHDITEIKKAELALTQHALELKRSNGELQQFAYIASHDLQEPLRKVTAFGDRLRSKYGDALGEQGLDYLTRMQNAAFRMQSLINGLLTYSRVATKAQPFVPVSLEGIAREVVEDLETKIERTDAVVEIGELPVVDADPLQMRQLFQNLIGNALKFQKQDVPPRVEITCSAVPAEGERAWCEIRFRDNGIGFEEKYVDRIFEVFQRLHGRAEYEGTGIGLAICRKIAERHRGSITARSTPGDGAEFVVTLPVVQAKGDSDYDDVA